MLSFCPRCGAEFAAEILGEYVRTSVKCPDCRLAITEVPAMLAPSDDEVAYELSDWPVSERGPVTAALMEADIPYRWESGLVLVVPGPAEEEVDRLLDELEAVAAEDGDAETAADDGDSEEDGGEDAQAAMGELFVAADRLQHATFDAGLANEMAKATAAVNACLAPYGIERPVWREIQDRASAIVSDLESGEDDEVVAANTRALRELLRQYV